MDNNSSRTFRNGVIENGHLLIKRLKYHYKWVSLNTPEAIKTNNNINLELTCNC